MSTATSETLNTPKTLNQGGAPRPADVIALGRKAEPATAEQSNAHPHATPVSSQVVVGNIKPVDRRTIEGSTPGDFRSQASQPNLTEFANPPGPREPVCQSKVTSSKLQAKPSVVPVPVTGESLASQS